MKTAITATTALAFAASASAVLLSEFADFAAGPTTLGWQEGAASPNPPTLESETGNSFVRNVASGGFGAGGRQIMFNAAQWTGDYLTAGVSAITLDLRNSGDTDLNIRLAFQSNTGSRAATTQAIELQAGSGWVAATFDLLDLALVSGADSTEQLLSNVNQMRILSAQSPAYRGDPIPSTLDVAGLAGTRRRR